jgi:hypothetical protein
MPASPRTVSPTRATPVSRTSRSRGGTLVTGGLAKVATSGLAEVATSGLTAVATSGLTAVALGAGRDGSVS